MVYIIEEFVFKSNSFLSTTFLKLFIEPLKNILVDMLTENMKGFSDPAVIILAGVEML
jgi:hypothetical protein